MEVKLHFFIPTYNKISKEFHVGKYSVSIFYSLFFFNFLFPYLNKEAKGLPPVGAEALISSRASLAAPT